MARQASPCALSAVLAEWPGATSEAASNVQLAISDPPGQQFPLSHHLIIFPRPCHPWLAGEQTSHQPVWQQQTMATSCLTSL